MSQKTSSLAVEELLDEFEVQRQMEFEPKLKVFINRKRINNANSITDNNPVCIRGKITISF